MKKSDAESSFYYMGQFDIIESVDSQKEDNSGKNETDREGNHEDALSCTRGFVKVFTEQYFKGEQSSMKTIRVVAAVICDSIEHKTKIFSTARGYGEFKGGWEFPAGRSKREKLHSRRL